MTKKKGVLTLPEMHPGTSDDEVSIDLDSQSSGLGLDTSGHVSNTHKSAEDSTNITGEVEQLICKESDEVKRWRFGVVCMLLITAGLVVTSACLFLA